MNIHLIISKIIVRLKPNSKIQERWISELKLFNKELTEIGGTLHQTKEFKSNKINLLLEPLLQEDKSISHHQSNKSKNIFKNHSKVLREVN